MFRVQNYWYNKNNDKDIFNLHVLSSELSLLILYLTLRNMPWDIITPFLTSKKMDFRQAKWSIQHQTAG